MTRNKNLMTHLSVAEIPKLSEWYHPEANKYAADSISSQSAIICTWICDKGHIFTRKPCNILHSKAPCTVCTPYREVIAGVNDLTTTHPEVAKRFSKNNKKSVTSYSKGHKKSVLWNCKNGHEYSREVYIEIRPKIGCPVCSGLRIVIGVNDLETNHPDLKFMWSDNNPPMNSFTKASKENVEWICEFKHIFKRRIFHQTKGELNLCPECPKPIPFESSVAASEKLMEIWSIKNSFQPKFMKRQSHSKAIWYFKNCGHEYAAEIKATYLRDAMCSECSYGTGSSQEDFLGSFIKERYEVEIDKRVRILDGKEIDILIPKLNKGVEFNGERWHTNAKAIKGGYDSAKEMHLWKLNKASERNIDLIYVWSHDWAKHRDLITTALDDWILDSAPASEMLLRLESMNDGFVCIFC